MDPDYAGPTKKMIVLNQNKSQIKKISKRAPCFFKHFSGEH